MHWNLMNDEEIRYLELLKLKYRRGRPNNSEFLENWVPRKIMSHLLNFQKFQDFEKITPELWRMHWNLMNDKEFGSIKFLKLKYRRVDQIIQTFCRLGSPQKLGPPSFVEMSRAWQNKSSESYRTHGNLTNEEEFGSLKVLNSKYRRGDQIIQLFFRSACFLSRNQAPSI